MANYFEKITVLIDVTTDKAVNGFKDFKSAVTQAEGMTGKFKAGVGSLKGSLSGMLTGPQGMAAAGTAIAAAGAFAFDSAQKFIELARSTEQLATATGLTNEEASRLLEVFGDLGGDASALQGALSKIPKTLDSGKWEEYGIATKTAGGELRSTNDILLDGLERLRQIQDPTARAAAGIDLFGKSWATLAPLINQSDEALRESLRTVSEAKVYDERKIASAKKLAAAQDAVVDAFDDFALAVGEATAELAPLIEDMGELLGLVNKLAGFEVAGKSAFGWLTELDPTKPFRDAAGYITDFIDDEEDAAAAAKDAALSIEEAGDYTEYFRSRVDAANGPLEEMERNLANRKGGIAYAAAQAEESITEMMDAISEDREWIAVQLELDGLKERLDEIKQRYDDDEIDMREYYLLTREEILKTKESLLGFITELEGMSPYLKQKILFEFDRGNAEGVVKLIDAFFAGEKVEISTVLKTPVGMPWIPGGTGPKDMPYAPATTNVTVNIGVAGDPMSTAQVIYNLLRDYNIATGGIGGVGRI